MTRPGVLRARAPGATCTSSARRQRAARRDQGRGVAARAAQPERLPAGTPVTVEEVLDSPMVADPLHRLDCCVITDGGGAVVVVSPEVARDRSPRRASRCSATARRRSTPTTAASTSPTPARCGRARARSRRPASRRRDIDYASIYDSFTITVLETIEDLGFCEKGKGGAFVADGALRGARTAGCRSTPTAAGCATTTPATAAG